MTAVFRFVRLVALAKVLPSKWKVRSSMQTWLERAFARAVESMEPLEVTATADEAVTCSTCRS